MGSHRAAGPWRPGLFGQHPGWPTVQPPSRVTGWGDGAGRGRAVRHLVCDDPRSHQRDRRHGLLMPSRDLRPSAAPVGALSREKMLALLVAAALVGLLLLAGLGWAIYYSVHPSSGATGKPRAGVQSDHAGACLLYTSDAADDLLCVDLGGRR